MPFTATESTTQPIVLGKEPVPKPDPIVRGRMTIYERQIIAGSAEAGRISFTTRYGGFIVSYHDVPVQAWFGESLSVYVPPNTVTTWEPEAQ